MDSHLPMALTRFLGRDREVQELGGLIVTERLVTVTGAGGAGKTRLALEAVRALDPGLAGAPVLVELAAVTDAELLPGLVGSALGAQTPADGSPIAAIAEHMDGRTALLVLDNCEHLVAACARLVAALLRYCPGLRILATSREPLAVAGETLFPIGPLSLPHPAADVTPQTLSTYDAVRLFIDRARSVDPAFALDDESAPAVADICVRLDGMPLAIELAAARVNVLSPSDIRRRLDNRFGLLQSRTRDASARQQTLRATLDWSYDLLTDPERAMWRRLAIFADGFELEAAEAVTAWGAIDAVDVIDLVGQLRDKSILSAARAGRHLRYRMLETLRAYGLEQLDAHSEAAPCRERHASHYAGLVNRLRRNPLLGTDIGVLRGEEGNLRAALDWTAAAGGPKADAIRLATALNRVYTDSFRPSLGMSALDQALALPGDAERDLWWAIAIAMRAGSDYLVHKAVRPESESAMLEALALSREFGEPALEAACLNALGGFASVRGDLAGLRRYLEEALPVALEIGDPIPATNLAALLVAEDQTAEARALIERSALAMRRNPRSAWLEGSLALVDLADGQLDAAAEALERARAAEDESELLRLSTTSLAACLAAARNDEQAGLDAAIELFSAMDRDGGLQGAMSLGCEMAVGLLLRHGRPELAAELIGFMGEADATPFVAKARTAAEDELVTALGRDGFEACRAAGASGPGRLLGRRVIAELRRIRDVKPAEGESAANEHENAPPIASAAPDRPNGALAAISGLSRLSLDECAVVGAYRRHDEQVRNALRDWQARMARPILESTLTRENFLIWAAPGSGKSFLVQETARALGERVRYFELNLARQGRDAFVADLAQVRAQSAPFLCLLDEIDARADEAWPYEESFSLLDLNLAAERRCVFVLVGSAPGGLTAMTEGMAARPKGKDLLDRVPSGHRFTIPALTLEDRAVVVASQVADAAAALGRPVRELERLALYYALVEESLTTPRQLRDLAVAAVQNLPPNEERLRYDDLFYRGDSRNQAFWASHRAAAEALAGRFLRIEP